MVRSKITKFAHSYIGGLTHAHTVLSNHTGHRESNLTIDRIVSTLTEGDLIARENTPLQYVMLNEHPSDPTHPRRLGRLSLRGRRLLKQRRRPTVGRVPVLYGLEVSLLPNGSTDLTPRLADRCPLVIASRHGLPESMIRDSEAITELFKSACENESVDVLGHPPRYSEDLPDINWKKIFKVAANTGTAIEINLNSYPLFNAHPIQKKFWGEWLKLLAKSKASIFIGTDIHNQLQLDAFISQWHELDVKTERRENHLAQFLIALHDAHIDPARVVTADFDRFLDWLSISKAERPKFHHK